MWYMSVWFWKIRPIYILISYIKFNLTIFVDILKALALINGDNFSKNKLWYLASEKSQGNLELC